VSSVCLQGGLQQLDGRQPLPIAAFQLRPGLSKTTQEGQQLIQA